MKLTLVLVLCLGALISAVEIKQPAVIGHIPQDVVAVTAKSRASRQAQYPPQYAPQTPQCLPPPAPFEGKACTSTSECDGSNTVLSCERGACTCPNRPALKWVRGSYDLNTAWDLELKKCVSLKDSACDIYKPKTVYCQKGLVCHQKSKNYGFGLCSTSAATARLTDMKTTVFAIFLSMLLYCL